MQDDYQFYSDSNHQIHEFHCSLQNWYLKTLFHEFGISENVTQSVPVLAFRVLKHSVFSDQSVVGLEMTASIWPGFHKQL